METISARCDYAQRHHSPPHNLHSPPLPLSSPYSSITVSDMSGVSVSLDMDSIWYMQQLLAIDQAYYPEMLERFIIINSPWYFPALYNMFKPFIDTRTREKVIILGTDYLVTLEKYIDLSMIPVEYGGHAIDCQWDPAAYPSSSGASIDQLTEFFSPRNYQKYALSMDEKEALRAALIASNRQDELPFVEMIPDMNPTPAPPPLPPPPLVPIPPLPPSVSPSTNHTDISLMNSSSSIKKNRVKHVWKPKEKFEIKSLRVSDMLSTHILSVENHSSYDSYLIHVQCGENISWYISRRYSEFYAFKRRMHAVAVSSRDYFLPKKNFFFSRGDTVTTHRKIALDIFLQQCLKGCAGYGTEEQNLIFRFLNVYENIIHTVELDQEAMSVMESLEETFPDMKRGLDEDDEFDEAGVGVRGKGEGGGERTTGEKSSETKDGQENGGENMNWKTPFAAAVLTAWVVISMMGPAAM
jgi:hypothetical protein